MNALETSETFINKLFRSYLITTLKKYFDLPKNKDLHFEQKQSQKCFLETQNISLKPSIFVDNSLPFQLKFSHIDSITLECNPLEFLDLKIIMKGVYLQLKLVEEVDKNDAELQERLRWIGYLFQAVSDIFHESGKKYLKRKLKMALHDKLWEKFQVNIQGMIISIEMPNKSSVGLSVHNISLQNNIGQTKSFQTEGTYHICKDLIIDNLVFFYYEKDPLLSQPMTNQEIKKSLSETLKNLTYYNQFESQTVKKFPEGALNLPICLQINIIENKKRKDILTSNWEILVNINQLTFNISPEKLFLVTNLVKQIFNPFEVYLKINKVKHQYEDFHPDILTNSEKLVEIALKYLETRTKIKEKYKKNGQAHDSEIINVEDVKQTFESMKDYSQFRNLLIGIDFETLFAAIKNTFLMTSKVVTVDEKSLKSTFLFNMIAGDGKTKQTGQNKFYETLLKWYTSFVADKNVINTEETSLEQNLVELKVMIKRLVIVTSPDSSSLVLGPFTKEKQLEIELNEIRIYQTFKNWLGFGTTALIQSGRIESRLELLPRLKLMKKDKIKDKESLRNLLQWKFEGLKYEIQIEALKRADVSTIMLEIANLDMKEQVYSKNYKTYNIVIVHKEEEEKENNAFSLYLDYTKDNGQYILKEGELELFGVKINDIERLFSYFDGVLEKVPSFMSENRILFPKETQISVRSEKTYIKIFNKRPYYQTLGSFLIENSENIEKRESQIGIDLSTENALNLETVVAERKLVYEEEENKFIDISSTFESIIEIRLAENETIIRIFYSPIRIVFHTKNLLHFFDEDKSAQDSYLPIPLHVGVENYFEKLIFIWTPIQSEPKPGSSSLVFQLENVQMHHLQTMEQELKVNMTIEKLEINLLEYYNSKTCISRRIYGDPLEPIYLSNTDFNTLSSLGVSQSLKKSSVRMLESSLSKAIEVTYSVKKNSSPTFYLKVLNPKLLISFPLIQRLQQSHGLFHMLRVMVDENLKKFSHSEGNIILKDFMFYVPTNSKREEDSKKSVVFKGNLEYSINCENSRVISKEKKERYKEYKAKIEGLEILIASVSNMMTSSLRGVPLNARKVLPKLNLELLIEKVEGLEVLDELHMVIKNHYKFSLSNVDISSKITLNDLFYLYETFSKEFKVYKELEAQTNPLNSMLQSTMGVSNAFKGPCINYDVQNKYSADLQKIRVNFCILSDMENSNFPALEIKLDINELQKSACSFLLKGCLGVNFNSLISHTWEPILEPFCFIIIERKQLGENIFTFSLDSTRTKELNINITEEFLDFLVKACIFYQVRTSVGNFNMSVTGGNGSFAHNLGDSQSLMSTNPYLISPYIVHNLSDMDIQVSYTGTTLKVPSGAKQFIVKKDFQEKNLLWDKFAFEMDIQAKGPRDIQYYNIGTVNLDNTTQQKLFPLYFMKQPNRQLEPAIVTKCQKEGHYTLVTFLTSIVIENNLPYPIKIFFGQTNPQTGKSQYYREYNINPGKMQGIPLGIFPLDEIFILLENQFTIKDNFWGLVTMENNYYKTLKTPSGTSLSLRKCKRDNHPKISFLSIEHSIILQNLIPLPLVVNFIEGKKTSQKTLAPNACQIINQANDLENLKVSVMVPNSFWSKEEKLLLSPTFLTQEGAKMSFGKNFTKTLFVEDQAGVTMPIKFTYQKHNPNHIFVSVDCVLVDKVCVPEITYCQEIKEGNKGGYQSVKLGQSSVLKAYSKNQHGIFIIEPTRTFRIYKSGMTNDSEGRRIDLNSIDNVKEIKLEYGKEGSEEINTFPITIKVAENLLHKEAQITMKSYTLYPTYSFYNKTNSTLILQSPTRSKMLNPGEFAPLDWIKNRNENLISLKQVFNNREMSNKTSEINIQDLNSFNVAFRNTKGNICGLINIRKLNTKDRIQIIASDQVMEHLYLIENKLPNIDLVVSQKGVPSSYAYHIKSGYKVPFAWDFPLKPKEIVVSPANPALRFGETTFNFHENIRTSMKDEKKNVIGIEAVLEFVPSANLMLSFRSYNHQKKEQETESLQINNKGKNIELIHKYNPHVNKLFIQLQKVSISIVSQYNRRRNETYKLLLSNLQLTKEDFGVNNQWNLYIKDLGLYKYQHKDHELARLDQKGNQNAEALNLSVIIISEKKIGDIARLIKVLGIKSNSLPRISLVLEELTKLYHELVKKSDDDESIYGAKKNSNIAYSIMNLTQAIANKRKIAISNAYILQEEIPDLESMPMLKKLFSYTSDNGSSKQEIRCIPIRFKNFRVTESEALPSLINEIILAGKAFSLNKRKGLADFVESRPFFAEIMETKADLTLAVGNEEPQSLLGGFSVEGVRTLNRTLAQLKEDLIALKEFGQEKLPRDVNINMKKSTTISQLFSSMRISKMSISKVQNEGSQYSYSKDHGIILEVIPRETVDENLPLKLHTRILYGKERAIRIGRNEDSYRLHFLFKAVGLGYKELSNLSFIGSQGFENTGERFFLIFTGEFIFYFNETKKKLVWHVKTKTIKTYKIEQTSVVIECIGDEKKDIKKLVLPLSGVYRNEEEKRVFERALNFYVDANSFENFI